MRNNEKFSLEFLKLRQERQDQDQDQGQSPHVKALGRREIYLFVLHLAITHGGMASKTETL